MTGTAKGRRPLRRPRLRHQALRRADGGRRHRPGHRRGRVLHHARPERLRQDDDAADDRRLRGGRPTGRLAIDDEDMLGIPPHKRPTNTVFQSYALFPHLSVKENVAFGLRRKGVGEGRDRPASPRGARAGRPRRRGEPAPGAALRRQQQRVALARALVNLPWVLLLDEPLGALDLKLRKGLQVELKRIQREVGITFVYVTHDQEEALTMSDRIAVMNQRPDRAGRRSREGLRPPGHHLRRRLHRRLEPDARHSPQDRRATAR